MTQDLVKTITKLLETALTYAQENAYYAEKYQESAEFHRERHSNLMQQVNEFKTEFPIKEEV